MIILFIASILLWGRRIEEETWIMALLPFLIEIIFELYILGLWLGV